MNERREVHSMQIFWPLDLPVQHGHFYGWSTGDTYFAVAGIVQEMEQDGAEGILRSLCSASTAEWLNLKKLFKIDPRLLGTVSRLPLGRFDIDVFGHTDRAAHLINYRRTNLRQLRFFTLQPLQLDVSAEVAAFVSSGRDSLSERYLQLRALDLSPSRRRPSPELANTIDQVNCAFEVDRLVQSIRSGFDPRSVALARTADRLEYTSNLYRMSCYARDTCLSVLQYCLRGALTACNCHLPSLFVHKPLLKDISATIQQIDTRLEQATFLPVQFRLIRRRSRRNVAYSAAQYISFYNCIWLVLNDVIVGTALGAFLCENCQYFGVTLLSQARGLTVQFICETLFWLDDWPVGLKLNTELSRFFCMSFVGLITVWEYYLNLSGPYMPAIVYGIGCCGSVGVTMTLSLISDVLSILTLPLYLCYMAATAVFSSQVRTAYSLFNIFRGKRRNVLRNRVDSIEYDLDQVLLGTILFTLVAFLFPTILAYYLFFASVRLVVISMHAVLETSLAFMNHFPLFVLMLRLKDPSRLPGGIYFEVGRRPNAEGSSMLVMKNTPTTFSQIFFQHFLLWSRLSAHYHPIRLLKCLVSGTVISPIPRYSIRYSMIPERRASFADTSTKSLADNKTSQM